MTARMGFSLRREWVEPLLESQPPLPALEVIFEQWLFASEEALGQLERLRERLLSGDENKDLSALTEQYHNQSAILQQLRSAGQAVQVDASSPYFAHLRLEEEGRQRDLFLGRTTCLEEQVRTVDAALCHGDGLGLDLNTLA